MVVTLLEAGVEHCAPHAAAVDVLVVDLDDDAADALQPAAVALGRHHPADLLEGVRREPGTAGNVLRDVHRPGADGGR